MLQAAGLHAAGRHTPRRAAALAAALSILSLAGATAAADKPPLRAPSSDPHDISGVWFISHVPAMYSDNIIRTSSPPPQVATRVGQIMWPEDDKEPPFTPAGAQRFHTWFAAMMSNTPFADPSTDCIPHGVPRIMMAPYPMQIVQSPGMVTMLFEVNHNIRQIVLDRPMPKHVKINQMGTSRGHWEGDTLVIETAGLSSSAVFDEIGTPHSDRLKVTERIRKVKDGKGLEDLMSFDDPVTYSRTWTTRKVLDWRPDIQLAEYVCEENNRNPSDGKGHASAKLVSRP